MTEHEQDSYLYRIRYCDEHFSACRELGQRENWTFVPYELRGKCGASGCLVDALWIEKPFDTRGEVME